ncbi:hypothetical protein REPUB_Repub13aG0120100 [Reevesia pubescens]
MDSKKIVSILFFFISFLITIFDESEARTLDFGSSPSPAPGPSYNGCWFLLNSCRNGSLTACIHPSSSTGSKELLLVVKNDGEIPLKVNVTMSHASKHIIQEIQLPQHQIKKVNIPANLGGNSYIQLDAGNLECVIRIGSAAASGGGIFDYIPFATHMTPINGAYLLFLTALIIGSTCACYKRGKRRQQGDGIQYQELEMGQPDSPLPNNVETTDGWEQDWDGDWDELKSKVAVGHQMANGSANGLTSRLPNKDGRGNTWDD